MTTTKHRGLYENIASILPELDCSPASILDLRDEVLALQLSNYVLHISLPCWVFQDSVSESRDLFVVTAPAVDNGTDTQCSSELRDILLQANEHAQHVDRTLDALLKMVELLGKAIAGVDYHSAAAANSGGEEEGDNSWYADDEKVFGSSSNFSDVVGIGEGFDDDEERETVVSQTRRHAPMRKRAGRRCHAPLHKRAEAAARACSDARASSGGGTSNGGEASSSSSRLDDNEGGGFDAKLGLRWCSVKPRPRDLSVCLQFDNMGGLIEDNRAAVLLGFDLDGPLQIKLGYDAVTWGSQARSPMPDSVEVNEVSGTEGLQRYGPQTMLREMVRTFYQDQQKSRRKRKEGRVSAQKPSDNEFLDLMLVIVERLQKLTWSCIICHEPFDVPSLSVRPCSDKFCLFTFKEIRLGSPILRQLQEASQVVQIELTFASAATRSRHDVFEPYPPFLSLKCGTRNRATFLTTGPGAGDEDEDEEKDREEEPLRALRRLPLSMFPGDDSWLRRSRKQLKALGHVLDSLPKVSAMAESENEKELAALINSHLIEQQKNLETPSKAPGDVLTRGYEVLQFVLSSNPMHLREIPTEDWLPIPNTVAQIAVLSDSPDRELAFTERMQMAGSSPSFFAFHGSPLGNWYSIMRNGLRALSNTEYMRCGNAFGDGLYLSTMLGISISYALPARGWGDFSKYPVSACAIVEVAPGTCVTADCLAGYKAGHASEGGVVVVSKKDEAAVAIRYILIFETYGDRPSSGFSKCNISGTHMGAVDLKDHFRNQRALYIRERQAEMEREAKAKGATKERTRNRTRASDRIVLEVPPEVEPYPMFASEGEISIHPTPIATTTILREYQNLMKIQTSPGSSLPRGSFSAAIPDEANVYRWRLTLQPSLFSDTLKKDLEAHARKAKKGSSSAGGGGGATPVVMEMLFSGDFPFKPPFLRVVSPLFVFRTGHVTSGGSVCMELLTDSGWSPAYSVESVLVQTISAISEGNGRIDLSRVKSTYSEREARLSFLRVARQHQWNV